MPGYRYAYVAYGVEIEHVVVVLVSLNVGILNPPINEVVGSVRRDAELRISAADEEDGMGALGCEATLRTSAWVCKSKRLATRIKKSCKMYMPGDSSTA